MKRRVEIKEPLLLEEYLSGPERSEDLKALVLKLVVQLGDVEGVSKLTGIARSTIYHWIREWNRKRDLTSHRGEGGGRKGKLSKEDKNRLKEMLSSKEYWTLKEVKQLVEQKFGVLYSDSHLRRILREIGMRYLKPYMVDYRRCEGAEQILKERFEAAMEEVAEEGIKEEEIAIGFVDESSPQNRANTQRVWSFGKPRIKKNTSRIRVNAIGFYALKGEDVIHFMERSNADGICQFLQKVKEANRQYKVILIIWDNFSSHRSWKVREEAQRLGIRLVFLPPYSPDLNPIEQIWRGIKRVLSIKLLKGIEEMKEVIRSHFLILVRRLSFCRAWITYFFNPVWNLLYSK